MYLITLAVFFGIFLNECTNTLVLTDKNFEHELASRKQLFVKFFAPWCGHCKRLAPDWDKLSSNQDLAKYVTVVKVDCDGDGKQTCSRFGVQGYPTLKFVSLDNNGKEVVVDYEGHRTVDALKEFAFKQSKPSYQELSEEEVPSFIVSGSDPVVVAFLSNDKGDNLKLFKDVADKSRSSFNFGYTFSQAAATSLGFKQDQVVLIRPTFLQTPLEDKHVVTEDFKQLNAFLEQNQHGLVLHRTQKNADELDKSLLVVYLGLDPDSQLSKFRQFRNRVITVAKEFPEIKFAVSLVSDFERHIDELFDSNDDNLHMVYYDNNNKYRFDGSLSLNSASEFLTELRKFAVQVKEGNVGEPYVKSQNLSPSDEEGPVKALTGRTFRDVVYDETKDVLVEFYSPSCGHCKNLEPIYKELAEKLKDEENLVIAKLDATANEFPTEHYSITGFPTIFFAKKGNKSSPVKYQGERTVDAFISFLKENVSDGLKYLEREEL